MAVLVACLVSGHSTQVPAATPAAHPTTTAGPLVTGFQPDSVTFATVDEGWALGHLLPCAAALCPQIRHTTDGGHSWQAVTTPPIPFGPGPGKVDVSARRLLFADARNGWAIVEDALWVTHDGASSWYRLGPAPADIEVSNGLVRIAAADREGVVIRSGPVAFDDWSETRIAAGLTDVEHSYVRLHLRGDGGWVVVSQGETTAGARLTAGRWVPWNPPCAPASPLTVDTTPAQDLVAICSAAPGSTDTGQRLLVSNNGGDSFTEIATVPQNLRYAQLAGAFTASDLVFCNDNALSTSFDGGGHWTVTYPGQDEDSLSSEFITASRGFVVESEVIHGYPVALWPRRMLLTDDGGHSWTPVNFGG
ncbi:sialidase family protein [Nocardia sp. alder85J]|uniref:sialidase family protein n=1 Tax=Nocardia sp. alder85J TaxID=2862949 RepID=UPI001CD52A33|nr:hypothetical protein [Nocardia sp. alder85J]MCX4091745.1 hypothetical protein [Nocardia sp. alder85J]